MARLTGSVREVDEVGRGLNGLRTICARRSGVTLDSDERVGQRARAETRVWRARGVTSGRG